MTRDDIIGMAHESNISNHIKLESLLVQNRLEHFANLVATLERKACAKMVEPLDESLADAIRARGQQ
jgi:hypothetical protein